METEKGHLQLRIEHFSQFATSNDYPRRDSAPVMIQRVPWILRVHNYKDAFKRGQLRCFILCDVKYSDSHQWSCNMKYSFRVMAQKKGKQDRVGPILKQTIDYKNNGFGYFILDYIKDLMKPKFGLYDTENDTIIVEADIWAEVPIGMKIRASLADRMLYLLTSGKDANVHFLVGSGEGEREQFAAHKGILSTISDVFDTMFDFDSTHGNPDKVIEVTDVKPEAFRVMLKFIYTSNLGGLSQENVFDVLHAAHKYDIADLIDACADCPELRFKNVLYILNKALFYDVKDLAERCWKFIDRYACTVLENDNFVEIDQSLLCDLFARDQLRLYSGEIAIWSAALRWADARDTNSISKPKWNRRKIRKLNIEATGEKRRKILGPALFNIRFPLIPKDQFDSIIVPTKVLSNEEIRNVFLYHEHQTNGNPSQHPLKFSSKSRAS